MEAARKPDRDFGRTGIEGIFDQFLETACRTLDNLACGDAIDEVRRQLTNGHPACLRRRRTGAPALPAGNLGSLHAGLP